MNMQEHLSKIKKAQKKYKPTRVRVLLIGESPPASGGYFYFGEGTFFTNIRKGVEEAMGNKCSSAESFLEYFSQNDFYLDDIVSTPIDKNMTRAEKRLAVENNLDSLNQNIRSLDPEIVIVLLKKYEQMIADLESVQERGFFAVPFPGNGSQNEFKKQFIVILKNFQLQNPSFGKPETKD